MNILMLVNWKIEYTEKVPENKQPPDYYVPGHPYWFFKYFKKADKIHVDVVDIRSFPHWRNLNKIHCVFTYGRH